MKLGGSIVERFTTPEEWIGCVQRAKFAAVTSPIDHSAGLEERREYATLASRFGITIAEVGVWKNVIAPNDSERKAALCYAKNQLAFADEISADCCVNIVGSVGERWDGAYPENYAEDTYALIVESIRSIIDAVKPQNTFYTIEPMPWMVPDGPSEYLQLIKDVDRERFGVHMDFVNMINSPRRYLFAQDFIRECFTTLGPHIKSCHAKDVVLEQPFTSMLREVAPGMGCLDYRGVLRIIDQTLPKGMPVLLEHLDTFEAYDAAYLHVAKAAREEGISIR